MFKSKLKFDLIDSTTDYFPVPVHKAVGWALLEKEGGFKS